MDETIPTAETDKPVVTVEVAKPEDAEALAEILTSAVHKKVAHGDMAWGAEPYTPEELRDRIEKGVMYIAKLGDIPVGTFQLLWDDERIWGKQPPVAGYVHQLAIKDGYRGMEIGKQLLDWAGETAASNGRDLLRIDFSPSNQGLKAYYESLGFKWVKDKEIYNTDSIYTASLYERSTKRT